MITLWIRRWTISLYIAESGVDGADGYDSYMDLGVGISWTWSW